ncbi:hypothetical protein PFLUV_G00144020 [Perca fluviatilis]|uniref:RRM domain-containing protein n=1 Tax=Perca fluviatilis TaxID=8168 RepID=A0A6A5E2G8_PERFL|nr:hypothetical protein PFLUV_G00144020 [Perca fluviatilis]
MILGNDLAGDKVWAVGVPDVGKLPVGSSVVAHSVRPQDSNDMFPKPLVVEGHDVDLKRIIARDVADNPDILANVKKVFVSGVRDHIEVDNLTEYFSGFGVVEEAVIISDKQTGRKRGFGFVSFKDTDSATKAVLTRYHVINGNTVETQQGFHCPRPFSKISGHIRLAKGKKTAKISTTEAAGRLMKFLKVGRSMDTFLKETEPPTLAAGSNSTLLRKPESTQCACDKCSL